MTKKRKTQTKIKPSLSLGSTNKVIGQSTKTIVGVTAFTVTANTVKDLVK